MAGVNTVYTAKRAALLTNPIADTMVLQADNSSFAAFASLFNGVGAQGLTNVVSTYFRATGKITGGTTTNFTPKVWYSPNAKTQITTTGATSIAVGPASAYNSASGNFMIEGKLTWDITSKLLNGFFNVSSGTAGTYTIAATTTQVTAVDLTLLTQPSGSPQSGPGLVVSGIFSATNAGNLFQLTELITEVL